MEQHVQHIGVAISSLQHELKGAEPLLGNSGREPGSRTDTASSYEQWELAAFFITAPSLDLFSQPPGMTEIWMLTLSPPERPANAAPSADQAPLMLFVPKDALNLVGISGIFKKLSIYTSLVSSACNVSCHRLHLYNLFGHLCCFSNCHHQLQQHRIPSLFEQKHSAAGMLGTQVTLYDVVLIDHGRTYTFHAGCQLTIRQKQACRCSDSQTTVQRAC